MNLLSQRCFAVRFNNQISEAHNMISGKPQGSVISPTIFNINMYDIPKSRIIDILQFADDMSIKITHNRPKWAQERINNYLNRLSGYFGDWKMILNETKTKFINIIGTYKDTKHQLRKMANNMKIRINGSSIEQSDDLKLLGLILQKNNRFIEHIKTKLVKPKRAKFCLGKILKSVLINPRVKVNVYKQYLKPIIMYASPIWCIHLPIKWNF